jgi:multiple sugar transport system substrate-binding protein
MPGRNAPTVFARRRFVGLVLGSVGAGALLAACGGAPVAPTPAPAKPAESKPAESKPADKPTAAAPAAPAPTKAAEKPADKAPSAAGPPAAAGQVKLIWTGWNAVDLWRPAADEFEKENPDVKVEYVQLPDYKKQTTMLAAGERDDVLNTRDDDLAGYADAGFIVPLDMSYPGVKDVDADTYEGNLAAMTYKGKRYGLSFYTDFHTLMYNYKKLDEAGFKEPPKNLNELKQQALAAKEKKIADFPIYVWFQQESNFKETMYALMESSGVQILDQNGNAPSDNPQFVKLLEWVVDGFQNAKIFDLSNLNIEDGQTMEAFMAGKHVFQATNRYDLRTMNDPKKSKIAVEGDRVVRPMVMPGTEPTSKGTTQWTRQITIHAKTPYMDQSRRLHFFAGAKNKAGAYWTAKYLHQALGLGFVYKSLANDADIIKGEKTWGDPELFAKQKETARPRQGLDAAWYSEWDNAMQAEWHKAILKQISPKEAVANTGAKWNDLKKQFVR